MGGEEEDDAKKVEWQAEIALSDDPCGFNTASNPIYAAYCRKNLPTKTPFACMCD